MLLISLLGIFSIRLLIRDKILKAWSGLPWFKADQRAHILLHFGPIDRSYPKFLRDDHPRKALEDMVDWEQKFLQPSCGNHLFNLTQGQGIGLTKRTHCRPL